MTESGAGKFEPEKRLERFGRRVRNLISRRSQSPHEQDPDKPYPQKNLIRHPLGGEVPAEELLEQAHASMRAAEIVDQDRNPRPEPTPLPEKDIPTHAFELVMQLKEAVALWNITKETSFEDGSILREYTTKLDNLQGEETFFRVQLSYPDSTSPNYGNLNITKFTENWPREYYFQANPADKQKGKPLIYYDDYPYHEENLGRPEKNTAAAFQKAQGLLTQLPKTT